MTSFPHHRQCIELGQHIAPALEHRQSFVTPEVPPECRAAATDPSRLHPNPKGAPNHGHILVVDDEIHIRESVGFVLETAGHSTSLVKNGMLGLEAVIHAEKNGTPFDLILTDIQMPVMDGLGLVDALIERNFSIPTVVITGNGEKDSVVEFMRRGCFDYLEKPLHPGAVIERVQAALDRALSTHGAPRQASIPAAGDEELDAYRNNFFALESELAEASNTCAEFLSIDVSACNAKLRLHRDPGSRGSGDFVDYRNRTNGCDFFVADGMCNDLAAAYYAILFKAFFEENHRQKRPGVEFLRILNTQLLDRTISRRQFNAAHLHINLRTGLCELAGAGTPLIYHVRCGEDRARRVDIRGAMLGGSRDGAFESRVFKMKPGDRLFFVNAGTSHDCDTVAQLIDHAAGAQHGALVDTLDRAVKTSGITSLVSIELPDPALC